MGDRPSFKNTLEGRILYELMFTKRKEKAYMNKQESDILNTLLLEPFINQRILAEESFIRSGQSIIKRTHQDGLSG